MTEHFYGVDALRSGIYHFGSEAERDAWIAERPEYRDGVTGGLFG